jgi:hypothetical protein
MKGLDMMKTKTVKISIQKLLKDTLNFDLAIQRNEVWKQEQKDLLIHSILSSLHINLFHIQINEKNKGVLDGKQRLTTILKFVNNEEALGKYIPTIKNGETDLDLKMYKFEDMPENIKKIILDYEIEIEEYSDLTDIERDEIFRRLNNGTVLTAIEKTRAMAQGAVTSFLNEMSDTIFFKSKSSIPEKSKNRFVHHECILQIIAIFTDRAMEFSSAGLQKLALELKEDGIPKEVKDKIINTADYLSKAYPDASSFLRKVHIPMIFKTALLAQERDTTPEIFYEWTKKFFKDNNTKKNTPYVNACRSGSAKYDRVVTRIREMTNHFTKNIDSVKLPTEENKEMTTPVKKVASIKNKK